MHQIFVFSYFAPSIHKILIECQFYPKTTCRFGNDVVLELRVKLEFFVWKGQSERKPKFYTHKWKFLNIGKVFAKTMKVQRVSEVSSYYLLLSTSLITIEEALIAWIFHYLNCYYRKNFDEWSFWINLSKKSISCCLYKILQMVDNKITNSLCLIIE